MKNYMDLLRKVAEQDARDHGQQEQPQEQPKKSLMRSASDLAGYALGVVFTVGTIALSLGVAVGLFFGSAWAVISFFAGV